jgi:hypothetical protein
MMRQRMTGLAGMSAVAVLALSGCSSIGNEPDDVVYCVDKDDKVVSQEKCDDDASRGGGGFFYMHGPYATGLTPGTKLDSSKAYGTKVPSSATSAQRDAAGLPKTGSITSGKSIPGKTGGFGAGSGKSGGFGFGGGTGG